MAETGAQWGMTPTVADSSDTDQAAESSVFAADSRGRSTSGATANAETDRASLRADDDKSSAELNAEIDAARAHLDEVVEELESRVEEKVESVQETVEQARHMLDPRRLVKEHPVLVAAVALAAIGLGIAGYRSVRHSVPIRLYLALRFGRVRELLPL